MSGQLFTEVCQADDLVEQLATGGKFEDDVVVLPRFGEFNELDDVGMVELSHNLNLFEDVGTLARRVSFTPRKI